MKVSRELEAKIESLAEPKDRPNYIEEEIDPGYTCLELPMWPLSLNRLLALSPHKRGRVKKECVELISAMCWQQSVTKATGKRRAYVTFISPMDSAGDGDNGLKILLDALVAYGALLDDGKRGLTELRYSYADGPKGVSVQLVDVPG
jgi:hypothetical protein